jgi:hypothetical protein
LEETHGESAALLDVEVLVSHPTESVS